MTTAEQLPQAYAAARAVDPIVFAEAFITGDEYTVGVLQDQALPFILLQGDNVF